MKKTFWTVLSLAICITALVSFIRAEEPRYKNLKVLPKDISKEDMDTVMKHFTASLGVKCNFCHVKENNEQKDWDFANDSLEHKRIARDMMKMTQKINKQYFKGDIKNDKMPHMNEITCNSCHNGQKHPRRKPVVAENGPRPGEGAPARQGPPRN